LMVLMDSLVADGSQVLLATHSPVLAAFPGATILEFGERGRRVSTWEDLPMVAHWRRFMTAPDAYLRHLFAAG
jgi:predicted ATPase